MKKSLLTLGLITFGLSSFAQTTVETKVADIKNTRVTVIYEDMEMTIPITKYDDQTLTKYFYDKNGNKVLESVYNYFGYYNHTAYWYDDNNKLVADSTDNTKNIYVYNQDGTLQEKTKQKTNTGEISGITGYEYENGKLVYEINYDADRTEKNRYRYTYDGENLVKREYITGKTGSGVEKISRRVEYFYDNSGNKIEEIEYTLSTTSSSMGTVRSATRYQYSYNASNQLVESIYSEASATSGVLNSWTNKKKNTLTYVDGVLTKEEHFDWDPTNLVFVLNNYDVYNMGEYSENHMPRNFKVEEADAKTKVNLIFDAPVETTDLKGYGVIINNKLQKEVYAQSPITLSKQVRGTHTYRVMALYDTVAGNVTNELAHVVDVNLTTPSNGRVLTQEYSSQWVVTFAFDAPQAPAGTTLTGYRYVVTGGNGGAKGTITPADLTKGTFRMYHNTADNEQNLVSVSLYAVYDEGESDPYVFQIDLRDKNNQIIAHWLNQSAEKYEIDSESQWENLVATTNFYYTSVNTSNTETLVATVENQLNDETFTFAPKYRTIGSTIEKLNDETMQWEKHQIVETANEGGEINYQTIKTTKVFNEENSEYETTSIVKEHYYYDETTTPWTLLHDWTKYYIVENGVEVYQNYVVHSTEDNNAVDLYYSSDETTLVKKVEYIKNAFGKNIRTNTYDYVAGEFNLVSYIENEYDIESDLLTTSTSYSLIDGELKATEITRYTGSKEYHYIKMPFGLSFKNGKLSWFAPSTEGITPTSYKVFANNILCAETTETSIEIENIPSGKYNFTVMCIFDGSESSLSTGVDGNFINKATFEPTAVTPTPYDIELDNSVDNLTTVTLTFPSNVASISEGVEAMLNSRFMSYPATASIADDNKSVVFTLPEDLENGVYTLDIPSRMINSEEGTYNPALNYTFSLMLPLTTDLPAPTPDPAEGNVNELKVIKLTFDYDVYALESAIDVTGIVYAEDPYGNRTDAVISIEGWDYTQWTLTFANTITSPGAYRVVIPEGTFGDATASSSGWTGAFTTGKVNPELFFDYTIIDVTVESISLDNQVRVNGNSIIIPEGAKVYSAAGYEVNPSNLEAGIYVVSFKNQVTKVIIR